MMEFIGKVLPNIQIRELEGDVIPIEAVVFIKCIDPDGKVAWISRWTENLHEVEVLGAMNALRKLVERDVVSMFLPDEDE